MLTVPLLRSEFYRVDRGYKHVAPTGAWIPQPSCELKGRAVILITS